MPSQTYTQPSGVSEVGEEEKSRRQKRREARQKQKTDEQEQKEPSTEDAEEPDEPEESKLESIWKAIGGTVLGLYAGGSAEGTSFGVGQSIVPPKPTRPDVAEETVVEEEKSQRQKRKEARQQRRTAQELNNDKAMADKVRSLAVLDPALTNEQRLFIQNMSDEQILEMITAIMGQAQNQDTNEGETSDDEIVEEAEATIDDEKDWSERVKDQWTEGKVQREARREARQQRSADRNPDKIEESEPSDQKINDENLSNESKMGTDANEVVMNKVQNQETVKRVTTDDEIIEEAEATIDDEKDWSERVKDQWTEGKVQREARREARQQRRAERQAQDD